MTDRQPRAPGQYTAVVSAAEYQKLQAGESFIITLTRNDDPEVEGTPYNKASVLPDDLAAVICPDVTDPTPADALKGLAGSKIALTLPVGNWSNNKLIISVDGVTDTNNVDVSPEPSVENYDEYTACGVRCLSQSAGKLTFICDYVPEMDVVANVAIRP